MTSSFSAPPPSPSSSRLQDSNWRYDVFLSFRGEDTRKNFVDHLYSALTQKGIYAFKDDERLMGGRSIAPELLLAIETSRFSVIIFSKNYSYSVWCLDELVKIMECRARLGQIVIPVFYDVDPSDVRKQQGHFGKGFARHRIEMEKLDMWRAALREAANLTGFDSKNTANGHEAQCIKTIVERISLELRHINSSVDENLIGIEPRMRDIMLSLGLGSDGVHMIGISGIRGVGKTTIARAVFDAICQQFECLSFVENIKEVSQTSGLQLVQQKLLSDVLMENSLRIGSVHDGKRMIKSRLCSKRALIVLDDVDHLSQLEALAGSSNWFGHGSRIIITTRDTHMLVAHKVKLIHSIDPLNDEEAIQLFCRYAFGTDIPENGFEEPSLRVIAYSAGLPLTLKALGSFLCGRSMPEWTSSLDKLQIYLQPFIYDFCALLNMYGSNY